MDIVERAEQYLALHEQAEEEQRAVFEELDRRLRQRFSRRGFFRDIVPPGIATAVTWGRWVAGQDRPRPHTFAALVPYLREHLDLGDVRLAESDRPEKEP